MSNRPISDSEAVIRRFLKGDEEAFTQLVRQWEGKVYNLALRFLGNREDAQDVAQETFLSVFRAVEELRDPSRFPAWLYRIALNHCRAHWRASAPEVALEGAEAGADGERRHGPIDGLLNMGAQNSIEVRDMIRKALTALSPEHRTAIILKEYLGLTLEEVAQVMDCPLSTAKSRVYHGLRGVHRTLVRLGARN